MKSSLCFCVTVWVTVFTSLCSTNAFSQSFTNVQSTSEVLAVAEKINGNLFIEKMILDRKSFITTQEISDLPTPKYIFSHKNLTSITFNGVDYLIKGHSVVGIKGLKVSEEVLQQITEKFLFLDKVQYDYAEKCNQLFILGHDDFNNSKKLERSFFLSLKILKTTARDIASFTKEANANSSLAINIVRMPNPNIDFVEKTPAKSLVQLTEK